MPADVCDACGDPLPGWLVPGVRLAICARCCRLPRHVDRSRAAGVYEGALQSIVHALKYEQRRTLAGSLAVLMRERGRDVIVGADAAVPVPLHPARRRERGFNQAADLASHLGLPVVAALRRTRRTADQIELPAAQRHTNVRGAFAPTSAIVPLVGKVVLLVDDVSTTGATLEACAQVLKDSGVAHVRALTAARAVTRGRVGLR